MKINRNFKKLVLIVACLIFSSPLFAYRPPPNPFSNCQSFLREKMANSIRDFLKKNKNFPPSELKHDPDSGRISWETLQEQAIVEDAKVRPYWQKDCHYAIAPWAMKNYSLPESVLYPRGSFDDPLRECIYCAKHGFSSDAYSNPDSYVKYEDITPQLITDYFNEKCRKHGLNPENYKSITAGFAPDPDNIGYLPPIKRLLVYSADRYGVLPFIAIHLLVSALILVLFWKGLYPKMDFIALSGALASLWVGLQIFYLFIYRQIMIEGWGARYIRFPDPVLGYQQLSSLLLMPFFIWMLLNFKKNDRPVGPVIFMLFATAPTFIFINCLSSVIAFYAFWRFCSDSDN